ncbi:MAG: hypothetical protein COX96_00725 [Candidatus Omnitrophica bacterium CG_4_10_14_0_2_um_filter_44_9]|nr:MAG: hypothetical protein COY78_07090 [Candidatus Omnitrophica bacterium CG_4_10_14_0_8_um_filter_44_12]PIZ85045.1 MAG: hypothetical protein COX96_00725 [Candidatus Omnitrophica bacterium CG_4_10_14_0_2_um_filter_44_9]
MVKNSKNQHRLIIMVDDFKKYLSVRDISEKFGVTEEWIRDLIQAKKIKATKIGQWRVKPQDLEKFIKSRRNY